MDMEHRTCLNCRSLLEWRPGEPRRDFERRKYCDRKCWREGKRKDWKPRFWAKVDVRGDEDCWIWQAGSFNGYGQFFKDGKPRKAHVVVAEEFHGPGREGQEVLHSCGRRSCVNPAHLRWGTRREKMRDMVLHGTSRAKLSPAEVREIRGLLDQRVGHREIGKLYGVSTAAIDDLSKGKSWGWLK